MVEIRVKEAWWWLCVSWSEEKDEVVVVRTTRWLRATSGIESEIETVERRRPSDDEWGVSGR